MEPYALRLSLLCGATFRASARFLFNCFWVAGRDIAQRAEPCAEVERMTYYYKTAEQAVHARAGGQALSLRRRVDTTNLGIPDIGDWSRTDEPPSVEDSTNTNSLFR